MPEHTSFTPFELTYNYISVQNGVILDLHATKEDAIARCKEEIKRDFLSLLVRKKLRKYLRKNGNNIALHSYSVYRISEGEEVKE